MAGRDTTKQVHCYELETAGTGWAENVTTFGTRTPIIGHIDTASLVQTKLNPESTVQLLNGGTLYIPGPMDSVKFETTYELCGHGSVTSGAVAATVLPTLLKEVFGYCPAAPAGTTISAGWTTTTGNVGASGTFPAGWGAFFGARRDGRADGQLGLIASHIVNAVTLKNALPAAPNNTDLMHSCECVHTPSTPTDARMDIASTRHLIQTADQEYRLHGVIPTGKVTLGGLGAGAKLTISIEWMASYFIESTATFPSALTTDRFVPAVNAGGSLHLNAYGTTTRSLVSYRGDSLKINLGLGVQPVKGPGGIWDEQVYVAARRIPGEFTIGFVEDAESATLTPTRKGQWDAEQFYTLVGAFNLRPGKRMGFAAPKAAFMGNRPVQGSQDNLNTIESMFRCFDDDAGATELEKSCFRLFFG